MDETVDTYVRLTWSWHNSIVYTYAIYIDTLRYTDLFPFRSDEPPGFITDILVVHALLFHSQYLVAILSILYLKKALFPIQQRF